MSQPAPTSSEPGVAPALVETASDSTIATETASSAQEVSSPPELVALGSSGAAVCEDEFCWVPESESESELHPESETDS